MSKKQNKNSNFFHQLNKIESGLVKSVERLWRQSTWTTDHSVPSGLILLKTTKGVQGCDSGEISSRVQTSLQTLQAEAIQSAGLHFERGKPNENLGRGSPGQQAGGNEMKHNRRKGKRKNKKEKKKMAELGRHIWAELGK